ncbi:MAG: threonine--tRNA ligase [Nitrososphaerota archaeon]|nr:threonine--tRNA ligase [Candidatus Calditenuaceae archaeon]MDW8072707.1 threonine--tRNA ligase [Nitrososphaerota archaeon]
MKALQLHVDYIEYEPLRREGAVSEEVQPGPKSLRDAIVLFTSIEEKDDEEVAEELLREVADSMGRLGVDTLLIYPYAHLSNTLAPPMKALHLVRHMERRAQEVGLKVYRAPFGWNKRFSLSVKGHPLAEQFRVVSQETLKSRGTVEARATQVAVVEERETQHVQMGRELDLFSIHTVLGSGLPIFHARGRIIRDELIKLIREVNARLGFEEVWTPHLFKSDIWYQTGHYEHYRDRMFIFTVRGDEYVVKPMNCPGHAMIYASRPRSYRDLPVMFSEFGTVYRNEQPGELTGLFRVRSITQDDGHAFVRPDQIEEVIVRILNEVIWVLRLTVPGRISATLSTRPQSFIGDPAKWDEATEALKKALRESGMDYELKEGEGAFYGPKIDVDVEDSLGRRWQCSTVQLDFFLPERLDLKYVERDGSQSRPIMIHRAILGSIERFMGILLEHYNWRLPLWLSPTQVVVLPVSEKNREYASKLKERLCSEGIRAELWVEGTLEKRIRAAHQLRASFMAIVGDEEESSGTVTLRDYKGRVVRGLGGTQLSGWLLDQIRRRTNNRGEIDDTLSPAGGVLR